MAGSRARSCFSWESGILWLVFNRGPLRPEKSELPRMAGGRRDGLAGRTIMFCWGNRVNIGWLLLCVFPADGVRVARAGRPDHVHVAGKLRLAFALDLSREACEFRLAFVSGLAGQRSQSCRGTFVVVVFVVTSVVRVRVSLSLSLTPALPLSLSPARLLSPALALSPALSPQLFLSLPHS